ncbi:hypothetical protein [Mixta hanseatica]|uniref:Uncharacterized protein n=1 Tax=Mixta hanseatica TaxID=2872648 RepID=A0ABY4RDC4_9GAMM|nr:hypothetical protein [Mixta hanseatica]UQY45022.1 hypothetical protein K6958_04895 [Mixta hanseatica]
MSEVNFTWFVRFTFTKNEVEKTETALASGDDASKVLNAVIQNLTEQHGIDRADIDILAFNRV